MKENKWIIWVILLSSLFGIANNGVSLIAFILSIVILTKYTIVKKQTLPPNNTNNRQSKKSDTRENRKEEKIRKKEEKEREKNYIKQQKEQLAIQRSFDYFDVGFVEDKVTNSKAAPYYKKIRSKNERVIDVCNAKSTKKIKSYKYRSYHWEIQENGILILTTENIYFLTAQNGFTKIIHPIKNINGISTSMAYLIIKSGRSEYAYNIQGFKRSEQFMECYINHFYA